MPQATPSPSTPAIDPRVCDLIERAQREHYRIGTCPACGGPEIFAKTKPAAKCLQCGRYRELEAIAPHTKRHRCLACRKIFYSVVNWQKCEKCRAKSRVNRESQAPGLRRAVTPKLPPILRGSPGPCSPGPDPRCDGVGRQGRREREDLA